MKTKPLRGYGMKGLTGNSVYGFQWYRHELSEGREPILHADVSEDFKLGFKEAERRRFAPKPVQQVEPEPEPEAERAKLRSMLSEYASQCSGDALARVQAVLEDLK